uniref:Uncharacterized protein n=1 Tax=Knipowitschia caucasica TaxID=637954 RepID=A0AAV2LVC6_KNICA
MAHSVTVRGVSATELRSSVSTSPGSSDPSDPTEHLRAHRPLRLPQTPSDPSDRLSQDGSVVEQVSVAETGAEGRRGCRAKGHICWKHWSKVQIMKDQQED